MQLLPGRQLSRAGRLNTKSPHCWERSDDVPANVVLCPWDKHFPFSFIFFPFCSIFLQGEMETFICVYPFLVLCPFLTCYPFKKTNKQKPLLQQSHALETPQGNSFSWLSTSGSSRAPLEQIRELPLGGMLTAHAVLWI